MREGPGISCERNRGTDFTRRALVVALVIIFHANTAPQVNAVVYARHDCLPPRISLSSRGNSSLIRVMLVRSAVRSNSTSSSEHDAYLASLLLTSGDDAGSEPAQPANPAERGRRVPPPFTRGSSLRVKRTNVFVGTRQSDLEKLQNLEAEICLLYTSPSPRD